MFGFKGTKIILNNIFMSQTIIFFFCFPKGYAQFHVYFSSYSHLHLVLKFYQYACLFQTDRKKKKTVKLFYSLIIQNLALS